MRAPHLSTTQDGFLIFRRGEILYSAPFDVERLDVTGASLPVLTGVSYNTGGSETSAFGVSRTGALVYVPPIPAAEDAELVWLDGQGHIQPVVADRRDYSLPSLDPDGRRVAVHVASAGDRDRWRYDLWTFDITTGRGTQLTRGQMTSDQIVWSSDGRWIVFTSQKPGTPTLFRIRADGGEPQRLSRDAEDGSYQKPHDFPNSVHGNVLMFSRQVGPDDYDLLTMPLEPPGVPQPFLRTDVNTFDARISPDGRWVAYSSLDASGWQILVRSFSDPARGPVLVASDARRARWSRDGRRLFYLKLKGGAIWSVQVAPAGAGADFQVGPPVLASGSVTLNPEIEANFPEPSPDGTRFLVVKRPRPERTEPQLFYVPNWLDEVREAFKR